MVDQAVKDSIQNAYRQYLAARDIKPRSGQRHMIAEIARYLAGIEMDGDMKRCSAPSSCVIEAGTGTGKTLAYLLAAIPFASALRKNIVISTATVTLQQQIIDRELPMLREHTDLEFKVALAKGRGRYLCLHRVDQLMGEQEQALLPLMDLGQVENQTEYSQEAYQQLLSWMVDKGWKGDWDSTPEPVDEDLWRQVTTDHRQCLVKRCGFFLQCPYYKAKAEAEQAQIIVANHDLVFSDLSLGGGYVLPPPEQTIYIFDEGHHLADKALNHFAFSAGLKGSQKILKSLSKAISDGQRGWGHDDKIGNHIPSLSTSSIECHKILDSIQKLFWRTVEWQRESDGGWQGDAVRSIYRYPMGVIPEELIELSGLCASRVSSIADDLEAILKRLRDLVDKETPGSLSRQMMEQSLMALSVFQSQVGNMVDVWQQMKRVHDEGSIPVARWLTTTGAEGEGDITVHVSPTNAAGLLKFKLWERAFATVLTSATLSVAGSFTRLSMQVGLPENTQFSIHHSPFNFQENCLLRLCDLGADPSDRDEYLDTLGNAVKSLVKPEQATLVLFSARKHMIHVARMLESHYPDSFILVQGASNKGQLLETHRERVDEGKGSLLFGLASFAEGLDLPGKYLTHVIIAKLPFAVPDDPVEATYAEWLRTRGGNPFSQVVLPDAITRLMQACGRLLRSEKDSGEISILDRRLWYKSYGKTIMNALPPYRQDYLKMADLGAISN
ncbi:ATP-dependent DNA helicase DinG [Hahella sp. CCB-MM4]|uniref:ATP-dependent DNA helicase DinG n=1 Tax=Hahella sp. (strain CCB-MM4) TaxID=1926491 RepID=UPI000B9B2D09|nr:ATP-dependent DNA helicase DinG [Hahella sp. CCB-MM4]OZG73495.1 ATP-dependent DNA helicase DinG [Hahella sp. CCB-MM4]